MNYLDGRNIMVKIWSLLSQNRVLLLLFIINILFAFNMNMVTPLQSLFIENLGANALEIGLVISVQGLVSTILMIPSGLFLGKIGKKRMLLISSIISMLSLLLFTVSQGWQELLPWAIIYGSIFSTFIVTRMSIIADHSSTESRATTYGLMNITWSIGSLLGPLIAGLVVDLLGWNPLFYLASFISFLSLIPTLFFKGDAIPLKKSGRKEESLLVFDAKTVRVISLFFLVQFTMCTGMGVINIIMPLYLIEVFRTSTTQIGLFLSVGVVFSTLLTQIPSGLVADKFGHKKVILSCALITALLYILAPLMDDYLRLIVVYMFINASWSMTWPSSVAYLVDSVPKSKRSIAISIRQTAIRLGFTIGPLIGGYVWYLYELGTVLPTFAFYVSAVFFGLSIPSILFLKNSKSG
jgi:MFS family permease